MDDILAQVLNGCKLAGELEGCLATLANQPQLLLSSCEKVVDTFNKVIYSLSLQTSQHLVLGEPLHSGPRLGLTMGEGSSSHGFMQPCMDVMNQENEIGGLGIGGGSSRSMGMIDFGFNQSVEDVDMFGRRGEAPVIGGKISDEPSSSHRPSSRKRKDSAGARTIRVAAPRIGNTEIPPDDGYTWRKYGQKDILGSKFPRSYYRCTHKNFYGCEAKKKVQRLNEDPYTYEVSYCGEHTCQTSTSPLIISPPAPVPPPPPVTGATLTPATSLSTSINLGCWFSREVDSGRVPAAVSSSETPAGRDGDYPVADLAEVMFNSGSSG
ncbi:WRKY domain-containing protein, partial [Dioscorea alata]